MCDARSSADGVTMRLRIPDGSMLTTGVSSKMRAPARTRLLGALLQGALLGRAHADSCVSHYDKDGNLHGPTRCVAASGRLNWFLSSTYCRARCQQNSAAPIAPQAMP